jgi:D-tyrosyl-tRNA(Tyr) deacylase
MRAIVQRVLSARVTSRVVEAANGREDDWVVAGTIGRGLCVFVGVTHDDGVAQADKLADKLWGLRVFADDDGVMNRSASEIGGELLIVSQFTLYGDTSRGRRPSWVSAARPDVAEPLIERVVETLRGAGATVATGRFRTEMRVDLVNDGPVTLWIEI